MSPPFAGRVGRRPRRRAVFPAAIALIAFLAACTPPSAGVSFDPAGPCTSDGKVAGAYPDLEALVPKMLVGKPPQTLDSGRNCTATNLGTLTTHGVRELRFAGGVWPDGSQAGITIAVFRASGLQSDWLAEWYEASARAGRATGNIQTSKPTIAGRSGQRLDVVNGDAGQTVVTWPSAVADTINVVLASDEPEDRIQAAIAAFP